MRRENAPCGPKAALIPDLCLETQGRINRERPFETAIMVRFLTLEEQSHPPGSQAGAETPHQEAPVSDATLMEQEWATEKGH